MKISSSTRMRGTEGHFLSKQQEEIKKLLLAGENVINLGRGNPDQPTFSSIVEAFEDFSKEESNYNYPPYGGKQNLKQSIIHFYKDEYGVSISENEVTIFSGSLAALTALPMALANPGENVLIPNPAFFGYETGVKMANANPIYMQLRKENNYLPNYQELNTRDLKNAKLMFLNYPNNPTGAGATLKFFEESVRFAEENEIVVVHDFAYADISFGKKAPSFMQANGAKSVGIELYTLSKTFNMAGWRVAFAVGNSDVISLLNQYIRSSVGGTFGAIQDAVAHGLSKTSNERDLLRRLYELRKNKVLTVLNEKNINVVAPDGTFFIWIELPNGWDDIEFANECLQTQNVAVVPGSIFGNLGRGFIRLSLVADVDELISGVTLLVSFIERKLRYVRS
ncbi:aminotransferase class I/II-fold pyridoxal phosphate-dependent enzyme [Streptococcus suis]